MNANMARWKRIGCTEKVRYRNKAQAQHFSGVYQQLPYKCRFCDGYHLTTRGLGG